MVAAEGRMTSRGSVALVQIVEGVCVWWSDDDGWGVLRSDEVESDVFAHFADVNVTGYRSLVAGQHVRFEVEPYPRGQDGYSFRAHDVAII
jgi:cold shock protein